MGLLDKFTEPYLRFIDGRKASRFLSSPEINDQFTSTRGQIETALEETEYFHGTGRLQYQSDGNSKYSGTKGTTLDMLDKLITEGLHPQEDLFSKNFTGTDIPSISLTQRRMYARVYASLYIEEGSKLDYEYGPQRFWWRYFVFKMIANAAADKNEISTFWEQIKAGFRQDPKAIEDRRTYLEKRRHWTRNFRNDNRYDNSPDALMRHGRSTIAGNTPMIIGVNRDVVTPMQITRPSVAMFETRTAQTIGIEDWSCIEVPFRMVLETRERIAASGNNVPVLPMEFVELIMRGKTLSELAASHAN